MAVQFAVVLCTNQRVQVGRPNLSGIMQFVEVAFAIGDDHQLRLGHAPRCRCCLLKSFDPAKTFLFINRLGVATAPRRIFGWPRPAPGIQHAQGHAIGAKGQQGVQP